MTIRVKVRAFRVKVRAFSVKAKAPWIAGVCFTYRGRRTSPSKTNVTTFLTFLMVGHSESQTISYKVNSGMVLSVNVASVVWSWGEG